MLTRLVIFAFSKRWAWLVAGLIVLAFGGFMFAEAHAIVPVEISGTLVSAKSISSNGSYERTEITLAGDSHTYKYNKNDMSPAGVDDNFYKDGKVDLWVDQGTTNVEAIQLYGQDNNTPTKYVSDYYLHPEHALANDRMSGEIIGAVGALLALIGLAWPVFPWGRKKAAVKQPAMVGAGPRANANIQNAYGQPEQRGPYAPPPVQPGYGQPPVQQAGWPQQPNHPPYGSQGQYGQQQQPPYQQPGQYGQPGPQSGWGQQQQPPYGQPGQPDQGGWGR